MMNDQETVETILHQLPSRILQARARAGLRSNLGRTDRPNTHWVHQEGAILPTEAVRIFSRTRYRNVFTRAAEGRSTAGDRRAMAELYDLMVQPITIADAELSEAWSNARYALDQASKNQWRPLAVDSSRDVSL